MPSNDLIARGNDMNWFHRAYRTRLNRSVVISKQITKILEAIRDQDVFIDEMAKIRVLLAELNQCIHEANAYSNSYAESIAKGLEP